MAIDFFRHPGIFHCTNGGQRYGNNKNKQEKFLLKVQAENKNPGTRPGYINPFT